jgi:GNAT superfamily N-acetyltransferase
MAQDHWAQLDYRRNITLLGQVRRKGNREIMAIGSYAGFEDGRAEVAFVVREDFQGMGIASYLLKKLAEIAITNGYKGFYATVLPENKAMLNVFLKYMPNAVVQQTGQEVRVTMDFKR